MYIGNRIKKSRNLLDINRKDFAKGIVSYSHLCNIESGNYAPSKEILIAVAKKLNVPSEYLLNCNSIDYDLENLLFSLKNKLDLLDISNAETTLITIEKDYPYISSITQEIFFYLLKSYYYLLIRKNKFGIDTYKKEVLPLLEDVDIHCLPHEYKETYYYIQGNFNYYEKNYKLSYEFYLKQLPLIKNNLTTSRVNFNIALSLYKLHNFNDSIYYAKQSLQYNLKERRWEKIAEVDNLLGVLYLESNQYDLSLKSLNNALYLAEKGNLEYLKAKILHNLGELNQNKKNFKEALELFNESLILKKKSNLDLFITYKKILETYLELKLFDQVNFYLIETKKVCKSQEERYQLMIVEATLFLYEDNFQKYEKLMVESIDYLYKNNHWNYLHQYLEEFANYYVKQKKYKLASDYFKLLLEMYKVLINKKDK